jgi:hypothetical protein
LQTLCNNGHEGLDTYFELSGWAKDTAGAMDDFADHNKGALKRQADFKGDDIKMEYIGRPYSPLFFQEKVLPTQVSMRVILRKASNDFILMHEDGKFDLKVTDAVLMVQKVSVIPSLRQSYIKLLEEGHPIPYFLRTPAINHITIEEGASQFMRDNLFLGKLPRRAYPRPIIKLDIENKVCADAYHNFMTSLNAAYSRHVPTITLYEYMNGFTLFSYDMSPDQMGSTHPGSILNMNSNIRLEMKFKKPTKTNITLLVYSEMDHLMEIHRDRRVTVDI